MRYPKAEIIDLETTGLKVRDGARSFAHCFGYMDGNVDIYRYDEDPNSIPVLQQHFDDTRTRKVAHNLKFEWKFLTHPSSGIIVPDNTIWDDTMIMHQMLRNLSPQHSVDYISDIYFKYKIVYKGKTYNAKDIDNKVYAQAMSRGENWANVDRDLMEIYQFSDGQREALIFMLLYPKISESPVIYADYRNEIDLIITTARIEDYGIPVDRGNTRKLMYKLQDEFKQLSEDVKKEYGEYYNLNSDKQLGHLLFRVLQYPVISETKKGNPQTNKDVLFALKESYPNDAIFDHILHWRSLVNGISLTEKYLKLTEKHPNIHTTINSNKAKTGRQSSEDPPLQNVSKKASLKNPFAVPLRSCFMCRPNRRLWFFDFKGIEMRLIIERSKCRAMYDVLMSGQDLHDLARDIFYDINEAQEILMYNNDRDLIRKLLNEEELGIYRGAAKNAHFALPYNAAAPKIANTLKWPLELVIENLKVYEERFPEIYYFAPNSAEKAKENGGCVVLPFGRVLKIPLDKIHSTANYDIQGTASGVMKRAEVRVDKFLREELNDEIRIVMVIHDELIFDAPDYPARDKRLIVNKIDKLMTTHPEIEIPLEVEHKESYKTWNDAEVMQYITAKRYHREKRRPTRTR